MTEEQFETVVVGSGFGGSVVARGSPGGAGGARARARPAVPARVVPADPGDFAQRGFWDPKEDLLGLFEVWHFKGLDMICAAARRRLADLLDVMLRKDADSFVRGTSARRPRGLAAHGGGARAALRPRRGDAGAAVLPSDVEPYASVGKARAMREAAGALGLEAEAPPLAVLFAARAGEDPVPGRPVVDANLHRMPRSTCRLCGECNVGCNFGAKNTLDYTYLSAARANDATIRACCEVRTIEPLREGLPRRLRPAPARAAGPSRRPARPDRGAVAHGDRRARGARGRRGRLAAAAARQPGLAARPRARRSARGCRRTGTRSSR